MTLSKPAKRMILVIIISSLVFMAAGAVFYRSLEALEFAAGVLLLSAVNVGKVFIIERMVAQTLELEDKQEGRNHVRIQYILRYLLTGAAIAAAALIPFISIWGAGAGILTFPIAAYSIGFMKNDAIIPANTDVSETVEKEGGQS